MNLAAMRTYVRDLLEVDAEDLPDSLVDQAVSEAYERIISRDSRWPFFETKVTLTTVADTQEYDLDDEAVSLAEVSSARYNNTMLTYTSTDQAEATHSTRTGVPSEFSMWGRNLEIWPIPNDAYEIQLRGYRVPEPFVSDNAWEPDLPTEFHSVICDWILANEYQRQDDPEMMASYRAKFEEQVAILRQRWMSNPIPQPLVWGGHRPRRTVSPYPWE